MFLNELKIELCVLFIFPVNMDVLTLEFMGI